MYTGHGIPQQDIDRAFALGRTFKDLSREVKAKYPFNPDSYLGWRGPDELETVTGAAAMHVLWFRKQRLAGVCGKGGCGLAADGLPT
jgi:hypothetical protein